MSSTVSELVVLCDNSKMQSADRWMATGQMFTLFYDSLVWSQCDAICFVRKRSSRLQIRWVGRAFAKTISLIALCVLFDFAQVLIWQTKRVHANHTSRTYTHDEMKVYADGHTSSARRLCAKQKRRWCALTQPRNGFTWCVRLRWTRCSHFMCGECSPAPLTFRRLNSCNTSSRQSTQSGQLCLAPQ